MKALIIAIGILLIGSVAMADTTFVDDDFLQGFNVTSTDSFRVFVEYLDANVPPESITVITKFGPVQDSTIWTTALSNWDMYGAENVYDGTVPPYAPYNVWFISYRYVEELDWYYYGASTIVYRMDVTVQPIIPVTVNEVIID